MPAPLLTFLKYIFLAVLYLFFLRVLRAVWVELREPPVAEPAVPAQPDFARAFAAGAGPGGASAPASAGDVTEASAVSGAASLVVIGPGDRSGAPYPLGGGETTVGRSADSGIALGDDTFVSQRHARLWRHGGEWWVEDLQSTNGTFVNEVPVSSPRVIRPGDRVRFGRTVTELRT